MVLNNYLFSAQVRHYKASIEYKSFPSFTVIKLDRILFSSKLRLHIFHWSLVLKLWPSKFQVISSANIVLKWINPRYSLLCRISQSGLDVSIRHSILRKWSTALHVKACIHLFKQGSTVNTVPYGGNQLTWTLFTNKTTQIIDYSKFQRDRTEGKAYLNKSCSIRTQKSNENLLVCSIYRLQRKSFKTNILLVLKNTPLFFWVEYQEASPTTGIQYTQLLLPFSMIFWFSNISRITMKN